MTYRTLILYFAAVSSAAWAQSPAVTINFRNLRPDAAAVPMYISFGGPGELTGVNLANKAALTRGTSYRLSELSAGVSISTFPRGRIYISLGSPLLSGTAANQFQPNFKDPNQPDFDTRWDKVEIDFDQLADGNFGGNASLSAKDFFSIPLQLQATGGGAPSANLSWRADARQLYQDLAKLSSYSIRSDLNLNGVIVPGNTGVPVVSGPGASTNAVRILSPAVASYVDLTEYRRFLMSGNSGQPVVTHLIGSNGAGPGGSLQTYDVKAYFANRAITVAGVQVQPADLILTGTVTSGSQATPTTLIVRASDFSRQKMFGELPNVEMPEGLDINGIAARLLIDFTAAMNFGFPGSTVDNPAMPGTTIGDSPSWTWFGNHPSGKNLSPLLISNAYGFAQPQNPDRYNRYAAAIAAVSDVQSSLHDARLQAPHARLADGTTLTLSVLPDTATAQSAPPPQLSIIHGARLDPTSLLAAGSVVVLGGNLPVSYETKPAGDILPLPTRLADLSIQLSSGSFAPIFSVTPDSALVQIPWELDGKTTETLIVRGRGIQDTTLKFNLAKYAPGIYMTNPQASKQGTIYDSQWRLLDASNPAMPGTEIAIYCTGLGAVSSPPPTGSPAELEGMLHPLRAPVRAMIGDRAPIVKYAGLAPGLVGVYQVNVLLPASVQAGDSVPVTLTVGGVTSNTVTMAIRKMQ